MDTLSKERMREWAEELLSNSYLVKDGVLEATTINALWSHFVKTGQNKGLVWNVVVLEQWYRKVKG